MKHRREMTDSEFEAATARAAALGAPLMRNSDWDHARAIAAIRENRRRYAHTAYGKRLEGTAAWLAEDLAVLGLEEAELALAGRVLLLIIGQAGFGLMEGVFPTSPDDILNVLGFVAADLCDTK